MKKIDFIFKPLTLIWQNVTKHQALLTLLTQNQPYCLVDGRPSIFAEINIKKWQHIHCISSISALSS